jgi:hypothetical protein
VDRPVGSPVPIHYLRTSNPLNAENLAAYPARIQSNRSNPYVAPGGYAKYPIKVFGEYLCTTAPIPTLFDPSGVVPGLPPLPTDVTDLLPDAVRNSLQQSVFNSPASPPCTEQPPNGRLVGQDGKYAQVKAAPQR